MSSSSSRRRRRRASERVLSKARPGSSGTSSTSATTCGTRAGSTRGPSSASQIPSGYGQPSSALPGTLRRRSASGPPGATGGVSRPCVRRPRVPARGPAPGPEARPARPARSAPTWRAMRVLPQPPGPVRVTRRAFRSRSSTAARSASRPMQAVSVAGRLVGGRAGAVDRDRAAAPGAGAGAGGRPARRRPRRAGQVERRHQAGGRVRVGAALAALQVLDRPHAQTRPARPGRPGSVRRPGGTAGAGSGRVPAPPRAASSASRHTVPLPGPTGVGARRHCSTPPRGEGSRGGLGDAAPYGRGGGDQSAKASSWGS